MKLFATNCKLNTQKEAVLTRQPLFLPPFDADPAVFFFDVDLDGGEAGIMENGFKGFRRRVIEVVAFDVFPDVSAEAVVSVDFGDEQERAAWLQDAMDFLQVFRWIGPEIETFDGRDFVKGVVGKGQGFDRTFADCHFSGSYIVSIRLA